MEIATLINDLARPAAFPVPVDAVETHQTHISTVFIAGDVAYKIRKPVRLPFLDFSTLEKRERDCHEEVRLNRRLAPQVYLGVVPITCDPSGCVFEGSGEAVEWAVKMTRLPVDATLEHLVQHDAVQGDQLARLGVRLADFHRTARRDPHIASFGRMDVVSLNLRENLRLASHQVGQTVSANVWAQLDRAQEAALLRHQALITARAERGVPCETHGDLHLDHVYLFPAAATPNDLVIVDCIEFNERFRFTDPIADMAFLLMDLKFHGRRDLAARFFEGYFDAVDDDEGRALVPLYSAYRAAVRGKVEGLLMCEPEVPEAERTAAAMRARGHWLLAHGELCAADERPGLLLVGGLPGTGKSTLSRELAAEFRFEVIRSDVVRKELAGVSQADCATQKLIPKYYSADWTTRTYEECFRQAAEQIWQGSRVIIDATFGNEAHRAQGLALADRLGVPGGLLICEASPQTIRERLANRHGDASDADWGIYESARDQWEPSAAATLRRQSTLRTDLAAHSQARRTLVKFDLASGVA